MFTYSSLPTVIARIGRNTMNEKILVVDDEKEISDLVALYLENEGFAVYKFYTAAEALECIASVDLDLAILDVMLPDTDGFQICKKIRERSTYPILMLTAKGEEIDKITGLTLGADDYVTKPFRPLELVARVKAQIRRYKQYNTPSAPEEKDIITCAALTMNILTHECTLNEKPLILTPAEFTILQTLCQANGRVVSAEELFHKLWGNEQFSKDNRSITVHIRHLREKMNDSFERPKYIKTIWGCGYKIDRI